MDANALIFFSLVVILAVIAVWRSSRDSAQTAPPPDNSAQTAPPQDGIASELRTVKVQHVIDGDTVIVSDLWNEIRVRLYGIDCPEDGQPWGNISKAGLIKMIGGRTVHMEMHGLDIHGRTLATLYVQNDHALEWSNVNERMVMLGHAWVMRKYYDDLSEARKHQLNKLERWARSKRVGLWKTDNPVPPWRWRREQ